MEIGQALDLYQVQLEADGRARSTRLQIRRHVLLLDKWLRSGGRSTVVDDVTHQVLAEFLISSEARNRPDGRLKKATSTNALRSSIRTFWSYSHAAGFTPTNPARLVRRARCGTAPPRGLSPAEQQRLLDVLRAATGEAGERDKALFGLMLATGIRVGSTLALDVEDVDLERGEVLLRSTKGNRPQVVYLPDRIVVLLSEYLGDRTTGPLFDSRHRRRLSVRQVARRLHHWLERAECRRASPHELRHSFGLRAYAQTHDPFLVMQALGHRALTSTLAYVRADPDRVRACVATALVEQDAAQE